MSVDAKREAAEADEAPLDEAVPSEALDEDRLKERGDIDGLLTLAKAYRSGEAATGRDMKRCLEVYRTAAELGSADAEYAVALFALTGSVVPQDLKEGTTRLRAAAEKGSVAAKVYLGNLYELGIHYKADPEKADVWYRNAARGAEVASDVGTPDHARALAELGCARYVLALVETGGLGSDEQARLLQRARAHGYGLRIKDDASAVDRVTFLDALPGPATSPAPKAALVEAPRAATPASDRAPPQPRDAGAPARATGPARAKPSAPARPNKPSSARPGLADAIGAFGYAVLFAIAGAGGGYAATLGARELVAHGTRLPGLGTRADLVFPIVMFILGVLPCVLVYRLSAVVRALAAGALAGAVGWGVWAVAKPLLPGRDLQTIASALAGFLIGLLVLGVLGGTKKRRP